MNAFRRLLELRRAIKAMWCPGMTVRKSSYGNGYEIGHTFTPWTLFTVYIDQTDGFSLFRAIPDIRKGIDIEDEHLIVRTPSLLFLIWIWNSQWDLFFNGPNFAYPEIKIMEEV